MTKIKLNDSTTKKIISIKFTREKKENFFLSFSVSEIARRLNVAISTIKGFPCKKKKRESG